MIFIVPTVIVLTLTRRITYVYVFQLLFKPLLIWEAEFITFYVLAEFFTFISLNYVYYVLGKRQVYFWSLNVLVCCCAAN